MDKITRRLLQQYKCTMKTMKGSCFNEAQKHAVTFAFSHEVPYENSDVQSDFSFFFTAGIIIALQFISEILATGSLTLIKYMTQRSNDSILIYI